MMLSMTGYAQATIDIPLANKKNKLSLFIQIKSVNARFFELSCKVPFVLQDLEIAIQRLLKQKLLRGYVSVMIKVQQESAQQFITPSFHTIQNYIDAIQQIKTKFSLEDSLSLTTLLALPHVLEIDEHWLDNATKKMVLENIAQVIDQLVLMREDEGRALESDLKQRISIILERLAMIKQSTGQSIIEKKHNLDQHILEHQRYSVTEQQSKQALFEYQQRAFLEELDKISIHEEVIRAESHMIAFQELLTSDDELKGKKIDFILQELNREINTITSKCSDFTISSLAIDVKTELEKCREQTQNIL